MLVENITKPSFPNMRCCRHIKPDALKVACFHGDSRAKATEALIDHDIVLTTYRTLLLDWKGRQLLQNIRWFRVVLDEGKLTAVR